MKRRDFVRKALTGGIATTALASCASPEEKNVAVQTQRSVQWRLTSSFPRGLDAIYGANDVMAARVSAMSGGRFQVHCYPGGEIVPGLQVLDAVQQGTVQMGQTASYYYTGKNPAVAFDACVPFGLTSRQQTAWLLEQGGMDLLAPVFADFNIISIPGGNTGVQMGGWFKREIHGTGDLNGLKMRIPGLGGEVMARLGAVVQVLAGGDIFPALERGAIDATEWVGPYDDEKLGFHKVAKFYYYPGWWEPGPNLSFYVNRDAWEKLPVEYREILKTACSEAATSMQARYDAWNPAALGRIIESGVELRPFSEEIMNAAAAASREILDEQATKDPVYAKIYEAWKQARKASFRWFGTAEQIYQDYVYPKW